MTMSLEMMADMMKNMSARDRKMMGLDPGEGVPDPNDGDSMVSPGDSGAPGK